MFVFEEGKSVVFISRHLEWCKGTLAKDYPEARVATIKEIEYQGIVGELQLARAAACMLAMVAANRANLKNKWYNN